MLTVHSPGMAQTKNEVSSHPLLCANGTQQANQLFKIVQCCRAATENNIFQCTIKKVAAGGKIGRVRRPINACFNKCGIVRSNNSITRVYLKKSGIGLGMVCYGSILYKLQNALSISQR
ncbi:hypothetical protein AVEN_258902-1 [Araneus ventricosus]|uniref:Uncharacterized protein n=1 Tax=Araneus ventricosus TaxID=182803 RepID=A0A4Y2CHV5_ARAVE|nr:hypothetical protein AVEN_258902-1 [Araneus ventricosus]